MNNFYKKIRKLWKEAPLYYWGDPLDVRFYLCKQLLRIRGKKILDMGCGPGIIISCLDKTNEVYGVDNDEKAIEIAKRINPGFKFIDKDIFSINFENNFFDFIILANVLPKQDYVSNKSPEKLISCLKKFLKPRGQIFLTTPNAKNPYYKIKRKFVDENYLRILLKDDFDFKIFGWNPFPIRADHALKYLPGIFNLLEYFMKKSFRQNKCVSFYVEAISK